MRLKISHRSEYRYTSAVGYLLQRVRLVPRSGRTQDVLSWSLKLEGAEEEVYYRDHFGNDTRLLSAHGLEDAVAIKAEGEVITRDTAGVLGPDEGFAPLWLFRATTDLTEPGKALKGLANATPPGQDIERLHNLMGEIRKRVAYTVGSTETTTTAEEALLLGSGVCQDHAQIFVSAARLLGLPARYVSGYLMLDDRVDQVASHAWAEAYVEGLGWVAFDPSNGISIDERYVRLAVGRDYRDAMPISGILFGQVDEHLDVRITVEQ